MRASIYCVPLGILVRQGGAGAGSSPEACRSLRPAAAGWGGTLYQVKIAFRALCDQGKLTRAQNEVIDLL